MSSPLQNIVLGAAVATVLALLMISPTVGGIGTWKYVLAALGLVLWFLAERRR